MQLPVAAVSGATGWNVAGLGAFDRDGASDILWRNYHRCQHDLAFRQLRHPATGDTRGSPGRSRVPPSIFDGDGRSDIFSCNDSSGLNAIGKSGNSATPQTITRVTNQAWKEVGSANSTAMAGSHGLRR